MRHANLIRTRHVSLMAIYQIIPSGDGSGFNIGVASGDGTRHTMLGFTSMEEAEAWIVQDRRLSGAVEAQFSNAIASPSP